MPIQFHELVIGDNAESQAARKLASLLADTAPKYASGDVFIVSNFRAYGYNTQDIDILVYGIFHNLKISLNKDSKVPFDVAAVFDESMSKARPEPGGEVKNEAWPKPLYVNEICVAIELKSSPPELVRVQNSSLWVDYKNKKNHDVLEQIRGQKFVMKECFNKRFDLKPFVSGIVWLDSFTHEDIKVLTTGTNLTVMLLPETFEFKTFLQAVLKERPPYYSVTGGYFSMGDSRDKSYETVIDKFRNHMSIKSVPVGRVTKKKHETLSQTLLSNTQDYVKAIEQKKTVIIRGRAGTGKTLKLLRIAYGLVVEQEARCLLLTYNHALVSDIKRLLAFHGGEIDLAAELNVMTLHKYFHSLLAGFDLIGERELILTQSNEIYLGKLRKLIQVVREFDCDSRELAALMSANSSLLSYDYLLIDEGQDWFDEERDLIRLLLGDSGGLVVSDGHDQLIRNDKHCNWSAGLDNNRVHRKPPERRSVRQKRSLVQFANEFARQCELEWNLDYSDQLLGGRIAIVKDLSEKWINKLLEDVAANDCIAYDLILATDEHETRSWQTFFPHVGMPNKTSGPRPLAFHDMRGKKKHDSNNQFIYSVDPNESRLMHYDSLRGIESWALICHSFDTHLARKEKLDHAVRPEIDGMYRLESDEQRAQRHASLWGLIAMTRPIDTIVLHLQDESSRWGKILMDVANELPDIIEIWD